MKVFAPSQIKHIDEYTILHEPISSIDLMERAARTCFTAIFKESSSYNDFYILCGPGNNGGDGLAIARMFIQSKKRVVVFVSSKHELSKDARINLERLESLSQCSIYHLTDFLDYKIEQNSVIIDALFGYGLSRPLQDLYKKVVLHANTLHALKISIDIPSGLFAHVKNTATDIIFCADSTYTFQFPKLSFFFAEHEQYVGKWFICDIGLHQDGINQLNSNVFFVDPSMLSLHTRSRFSHKGMCGHALIIAGSEGKGGAAILSSRACLHSGAGLVTAYVPQNVQQALLSVAPEIMTITNNTTIDLEKYSAIGIGPGFGIESVQKNMLQQVLTQSSCVKVIDADAITLLATHTDMMQLLSNNCVLTPHPGEFDRLTHYHASGFERFITQQKLAQELGCYIVLKGAYTSICTPHGDSFFNSTGNQGMATAGSGDVLTGIITGLLAQKFSVEQACVLGVYLHGLAADISGESYETLSASHIINNLSKAFQFITRT